MPQCAALKCNNIGRHLFPKCPKRRKQWENALRIKNFKASDSARLCGEHFKEDDYFGKSNYQMYAPLAKFLKKTAVPSIFCFTKTKPENPAANERQYRCEIRCLKKQVFDDLQHSFSETTTINKEICDLIPAVSSYEEVVTENIAATLAPVTNSTPESKTTHHLEFVSKGTQVDREHMYGSIYRYKEDDKSIQFYTGFGTYKKFKFVFDTLSPWAHKIHYYRSNVLNLSTEDQFYLTIMKLRQNKCNFELSKFFNISETTVSNIFITWINYIYQLWSKMYTWPSKKLVEYYMCEHFKNYDENIRVVSDRTEIEGRNPKNHKLGPAEELLSYCSLAYAGSFFSDNQIVETSDLTTKCQSGDSILADKGIQVQDMFANQNVADRIPTIQGKSQLPGMSIVKDGDLGSKSARLKRIMRLIKTYKIMKYELDHSYIPIAHQIFFVCFMCCNFKCSMNEEEI